ncbi:hypothetical protein C2W58_04001 [Bacillus pumilus]|nr:hypothetical protein C2W58_04001 [Bacillus pumilus]
MFSGRTFCKTFPYFINDQTFTNEKDPVYKDWPFFFNQFLPV